MRLRVPAARRSSSLRIRSPIHHGFEQVDLVARRLSGPRSVTQAIPAARPATPSTLGVPPSRK